MANGWDEDAKLIRHQIGNHDQRLEEIEEQLILIRIADAQRRVRAGLWGAAFGTIPALLAVAAAYLGSH